MNTLTADAVYKVTFRNENPRAPFYLITVETGTLFMKVTHRDSTPHVDAVREYDIVITPQTPLKLLKINFLYAGSWYICSADGAIARYAVMELF